MSKYKDNYLGFKIIGRSLPITGDNNAWLFNIFDDENQKIFDLRIKISRNVLDNQNLNLEEEDNYIREEGLRRVRGRLTLFQFKKETEYGYNVQTTGELVQPPLMTQEYLYNSEEEKFKFHFLESLARIRNKLLPQRPESQ